ncbi:MAG: hypothetical protein GX088_06355 [Clostridia bacterium]|nr:hypothetical protein [Clostridia bacterium]
MRALFGLYVERFFPFVCAIFAGFAVFIYGLKLKDIKNVNELLAATVNVSAILIGFLSVMISILISITGSRVMKRIRENNATELLNSYFFWALISGFIVAISSMVLTVFYNIDLASAKFLTALWVFITTFFLISSFRIVLILLRILKNVVEEDEAASKPNYIRPDGKKAFPHK